MYVLKFTDPFRLQREGNTIFAKTPGDFELVEETVNILSRKWRPRIIYYLIENSPASFSELKRNIGNISNKMLSQSLKELTEHDICERKEKEGGEVIYSLTEKGRDMEDILASLENWGEKYTENSRQRKILVVEDNRHQAEMYRRWLEPGYEVILAQNKDEVFKKYSEDVDIIFLDRRLGNYRGEDILEESEEIANKDIVMITAVEPEMDIIDIDINDYIIKPISKEKLKRKVEKLEKTRRKDQKAKELLSLVSKKTALESKKSNVSLDNNERYQQLSRRIEELREEINNDNLNEDMGQLA